MKIRTLIILFAVLIALASLVGILAHRQGPREKETRLGEPLFKDLKVNDIAIITIQGPEGKKVQLCKGKSSWGVTQRYGYPADFEKIQELVRNIANLKIGRSFETNTEVLSRLKLISPLRRAEDARHQGILISLKDKDGQELAGIIIGKQHTSREEGQPGLRGQYVRLTKNEVVYLVDKSFPFIQTDPKGWLDKSLIRVKPEDIRRISCIGKNGKVIYTFERQGKRERLEAKGPLKGKSLNISRLNRLERAISFLSLSDVLKPAPDAKGIDKGTYVIYELFDGIRYKIFPCVSEDKDKGEHHLKIKVDYVPPPTKTLKQKENNKKNNKQEDQINREEIKLKAEQLNEKLSPWIFVVSKWNAQAFVTDSRDLIEKKSEKKTRVSKPKRAERKS